MLSGVVCLSCTHKRQQSQPEATPDKESAIIGGSDTVTSIQVASADKDTVIYDTPECFLWYVEDLPDKYKDKPVSMWTERPVYWENVRQCVRCKSDINLSDVWKSLGRRAMERERMEHGQDQRRHCLV